MMRTIAQDVISGKDDERSFEEMVLEAEKVINEIKGTMKKLNRLREEGQKLVDSGEKTQEEVDAVMEKKFKELFGDGWGAGKKLI